AIRGIAWEARTEALAGASLLVNATSLGMEGQPPLDLPLDSLPRDAVVNDIVYVPLETDLLARARARGNPAVDGLGMLLHQARPGFEAWFGVMPAVTPELRAAVLATLGRKRDPAPENPPPHRGRRHGQEHGRGDAPPYARAGLRRGCRGSPHDGQGRHRRCRGRGGFPRRRQGRRNRSRGAGQPGLRRSWRDEAPRGDHSSAGAAR